MLKRMLCIGLVLSVEFYCGWGRSSAPNATPKLTICPKTACQLSKIRSLLELHIPLSYYGHAYVGGYAKEAVFERTVSTPCRHAALSPLAFP